jgi:hypothetical protein
MPQLRGLFASRAACSIAVNSAVKRLRQENKPRARADHTSTARAVAAAKAAQKIFNITQPSMARFLSIYLFESPGALPGELKPAKGSMPLNNTGIECRIEMYFNNIMPEKIQFPIALMNVTKSSCRA